MTCQSCSCPDLSPVLWLGYHAPVNDYRPIGSPAAEQPTHPLELLLCPRCELVQLGYVPDQTVTFPADYPYRSGTTKLLRDNFAELSRAVRYTVDLRPHDLVVDIGSNDGTLLANFAPHCQVRGITPEDAAIVANERGIRTVQSYFTKALVSDLLSRPIADYAYTPAPLPGHATVITATNVFAHVPDPHDFLEGVKLLLAEGGIFVSESHYLHALLDGLQFDTLYSEHARFYSLNSLAYLLEMHGLQVFRAERIATHGGSIRVWACRKGERAVETSVASIAFWEHHRPINADRFASFQTRMTRMREALWAAIAGKAVHGIGAPSRASTLVQYVGLDHHAMPVTYETAGSAKIGKYMPGSRIEVRAEPERFDGCEADALLLLSHHIADELVGKLREKGWTGPIVRPLPEVEVLE